MTAKSGFVGTDEDRFIGPKGEAYFLQINPKTGETEVWNEEFGQDRAVGTFNADGNFVPDRTFTKGARDFEEDYFNSEEGRKAVLAQTETVLEKTDGQINGSDEVMTEQAQNDFINETRTRTTDSVDSETREANAADRELQEEQARDKNIAELGGKAIGREQYGHYCYPVTLRRGQQDRLRISVLKFKPKTMSADGLGFDDRNERIISTSSRRGSGERAINGEVPTGFQRIGQGRRGLLERTAIGSCILPINKVGDSNKVKWDSDSMNAGQIAMANIALTALDAGIAAGGEATKETIESATGAKAGEVSDAVKNFFVQQATGVKNIMARTSGSVINPNMELIFGGPQLRSFGFTYLLAARDPKESQEIKKIIRMFKQSMSPQTTDGALFLKAPNTYRLQYLTAGQNKEQPFLPKVKECALTSFNVNYVPNNQYMTYEDNSMISYEVTFAFQELEPFYNADYTDLDGDTDQSIGY
tara:strand:- start:657 stop:2078 length:1422 start_codon:yes stop_codon:yes gene_type:complete